MGLAVADEKALFKWLLASFLFGKPIQQSVAERAYRVLVEQHGLDSPARLARCSQQELVRLLGQARYVRYDISTADRLLRLSRKLLAEYDGSVIAICRQSSNQHDFAMRLLAFEGIGPKTVEIFMREAEVGLYGQS
ncbi:DNA methylase [Pseudomonas sp. CNPSo 3701]|uniref:DNA methylase n=1 Tax=Pseudomonas sp. CNPSo 3701 TaxID=3027943 RepID=UPI002363CB80|nr:DNA methylase [Pseudomonas sp. CNPSo 3701]MDD1509824.1 DNA methylase [Pseudomonas sp. CNPSo 3701]